MYLDVHRTRSRERDIPKSMAQKEKRQRDRHRYRCTQNKRGTKCLYRMVPNVSMKQLINCNRTEHNQESKKSGQEGFFIKKWGCPGLFLFIFILFTHKFYRKTGFELESSEQKASTLTTRPPPRPRKYIFSKQLISNLLFGYKTLHYFTLADKKEIQNTLH